MVGYNKSPGRKVFNVFNVILILAICFISLYPFWFVLTASFSTDTFIAKGQVSFWPKGFTLHNYDVVFHYRMIWRSYMNTIIYTVLGTVVSMVMTTIGAYCLSRKTFYGRPVFMMMVTITMLFGGGMIPTYLVVNDMHLIDTIWAMVLPGAVSAWNLIMLRSFFMSIPDSLLESAEIDGASEWTMMVRIVVPLSLASLMTISLFYAVAQWNGYFSAMLYLNREQNFPLQLILREIVIRNTKNPEIAAALRSSKSTGQGMRYATIIVAVVPILIVYPFIQRYFVKGVMIGSLKG